MRVNLVEAVSVLVKRVTDGEGAVPEGRVQHVDVPIDQSLLVALEQLPNLGHHLGDVRGHIDHRLPSRAFATATSVASLPGHPMMDSPTGSPSTLAPGKLT